MKKLLILCFAFSVLLAAGCGGDAIKADSDAVDQKVAE